MRKIIVFLGTVVTIVLIVGSLMYLVEGESERLHQHPPEHLLGHRDHDHRGLRRHRAPDGPREAAGSVVMILGYGIIAVPTGIVTVELAQARRAPISTEACPDCGSGGHDSDAEFCKYCGARL